MCCPSSQIFVVKKINAWVFHLIHSHPSKKSFHPIRLCIRASFDNVVVLLVGITFSLPLYYCSLFTISCTVFIGVLLSNKISSRAFIVTSHISLATLLLHNRTWLVSSLSLQGGHTSVSLHFHCFIFTPVPQNLETCLDIQILLSKVIMNLSCLTTFQSKFSFYSNGNLPNLFQYFIISSLCMMSWIVLT